MLYYSGDSTIPATGTSTGTSCCTSCSCPNCGYQYGTAYAIDYGFCDPFAGQTVIVVRDRTPWPRPRSDPPPAWMIPFLRTGFDRPGRELRHRGNFRNFHK